MSGKRHFIKDTLEVASPWAPSAIEMQSREEGHGSFTLEDMQTGRRHSGLFLKMLSLRCYRRMLQYPRAVRVSATKALSLSTSTLSFWVSFLPQFIFNSKGNDSSTLRYHDKNHMTNLPGNKDFLGPAGPRRSRPEKWINQTSVTHHAWLCTALFLPCFS